MKRLISFALLLCVIFVTGCSDSGKTYSQEAAVDYSTEMQVYYHQHGANVPMTKSDTGYYYVGEDNIVIYVDKESKKATPLCSKPNCLHDDPDTCDAYFNIEEYLVDKAMGTFGNAIQYYDGHLYLLCGEYDESYIEYNLYLVQADPDGKNRRQITDYFEDYFEDWFIHRGYFYYMTASAIKRLPMDNPKAEPEIVYEVEHYIEESNAFHGTFAYKNYLYANAHDRDEEGNGKGSQDIYVNLDTMESAEMPYIDDTGSAPLTFISGKLVLCCPFLGGSEENVYYTSNLDGSDYKEFYRVPHKESKALTCDGQYIYLDNDVRIAAGSDKDQVIEVYDLDMNFVDSFKLPKTCHFFNPQDNEYFILESVDDNGERILVMADKSQIGSINGETIEYTELCKLDWYEKPRPAYITAE